MIDEFIQALLRCDRDAVLGAYTLDHPEFSSRAYVNRVEHKLLARGDFFTTDARCKKAGEFQRTIYRSGMDLVVEHNSIAVWPDFRGKGLAMAHYRKALRFYDRQRVRYVHLQAIDWGPVVWPTFGFDVRAPEHRMRIDQAFVRLYREIVGEVPPLPATVPEIAATETQDGIPIGLSALRLAYEAGEREPIPMILELRDQGTRSFLHERGILEAP